MRRWVSSLGRRWEVVAAIALVGLAFVPGVAGQGVELGELALRAPDALGWALVVLQGAGVALLRWQPALSLAIVGTAFGAYQLLGYPTTFAALGLLVAVTGTGALLRGRRGVTIGLAAAAYVVLCVGLALSGSPTGPLDFVVFGTLLAALWLAGAWLRGRAVAQEQRRLEAERAAVGNERSRIARELHDVITHHVTAMVVQADAAQYGVADAAGTGETLSAISDTGRAALTDLRGLLDALDTTGEDQGRSPTVRGLDELVDGARAAGLRVEFQRVGNPRPLNAAAELAVSRVVQESLTNAMKHAPSAMTRVRVGYTEEEIDVRITTSGVSGVGPGRGGGKGLLGLRERVALVGGTFDAGPDGDGFSVQARVPA